MNARHAQAFAQVTTALPGPKSRAHHRARGAVPGAGHPADLAARRPRLDGGEGAVARRRRRQSLPRLRRRHRRGVARPRPSGARRGAARAGASSSPRAATPREARASLLERIAAQTARIGSGKLTRTSSTRAAPRRSRARCAWRARTPRSTKSIAFWGGFHGKTTGVLALMGSDFKHGLGPLPPGHLSCRPWGDLEHARAHHQAVDDGRARRHHRRADPGHRRQRPAAARLPRRRARRSPTSTARSSSPTR